MANLSKIKRDRMLAFLETLKEQHTDDESLRAFTEIENQLREKKYGLVWEEHSEHVDEMLQENIPVFCEDADREIMSDPELPYNFILEGDNLQSLYLLEKTHKGRIDVIYIDPPYNRGKDDDFIFDDNYVAKEDGFRHSKWLSFISSRLNIAASLLSNTGVIFISIDENEFAQLKLLCDEIFGEVNFIECLVWNKRVPKNDKGIGNIHEYILIYAKKSDFKYKFTMLKEGLDQVYSLVESCKKQKISIEQTEKKLKQLYRKGDFSRAVTLYNAVDEEYRIWGKINMSWPNGNTFGPRYEVLHPKTHKAVRIPDRGWRWSQDTFDSAVDYEHIVERYDGSLMCGQIWFAKDENMQPSSIKYLDDVNRMLLRSIISLKSDGSIELEKIFSEKSRFAYPKSVALVKLLIDSITHTNRNSIILDFFAGSGTTAQAVLDLNEKDDGSRNFVLCTNNENNICENITYPRIKTVITGRRADGSIYSDGIPANLKYFKCDWIPRKPQEYLLSNALCLHIKEMIELQHAIKVDQLKNIVILNKNDLEATVLNPEIYAEAENIWVNQNIILSAEELRLLQAKDFKYIPKEFFGQELKEAAE